VCGQSRRRKIVFFIQSLMYLVLKKLLAKNGQRHRFQRGKFISNQQLSFYLLSKNFILLDSVVKKQTMEQILFSILLCHTAKAKVHLTDQLWNFYLSTEFFAIKLALQNRHVRNFGSAKCWIGLINGLWETVKWR